MGVCLLFRSTLLLPSGAHVVPNKASSTGRIPHSSDLRGWRSTCRPHQLDKRHFTHHHPQGSPWQKQQREIQHPVLHLANLLAPAQPQPREALTQEPAADFSHSRHLLSLTHSCAHTRLLQRHHLEITTKQGYVSVAENYQLEEKWKSKHRLSSSASVLTHWKFWPFLPVTHLTDQKAQLWPEALPALLSPGAETEVLGRSAGPLTPATLVGEMPAPSALTSLGPAPRDSDPRPTRPPRSEGGADPWGASGTAP